MVTNGSECTFRIEPYNYEEGDSRWLQYSLGKKAPIRGGNKVAIGGRQTGPAMSVRQVDRQSFSIMQVEAIPSRNGAYPREIEMDTSRNGA